MKKFTKINVVSCLLLFGIILCACSSNAHPSSGDMDAASIIGTWEWYERWDTITFYSDGTWEGVDDYGSTADNSRYHCSWSYENGVLTISTADPNEVSNPTDSSSFRTSTSQYEIVTIRNGYMYLIEKGRDTFRVRNVNAHNDASRAGLTDEEQRLVGTWSTTGKLDMNLSLYEDGSCSWTIYDDGRISEGIVGEWFIYNDYLILVGNYDDATNIYWVYIKLASITDSHFLGACSWYRSNENMDFQKVK